MSDAEIVDVVDLSDRVIGSAPRGALVDRGLNYRVVHVLVQDREGNLLLQCPARHLQKAFRLGSSVAGHVRSGETYAQAARREYREELGVEAPEMEHVGTTWLDEDGRRKFIGVFLARDARLLHPDPLEVERIERVPLVELTPLLRDEGALSATFRRVLKYVEERSALKE